MSFRIRHKFIVLCALVAGVFFLSGLLIRWQTPKLRAMIMLKVEQATRDKYPVRIVPGSVEVTFFPLGARLTDVHVLPTAEAKEWLEPASFEGIGVRISPWQLLRGRLRLTQLDVDGARVEARLPKFEKKEKKGNPLAGLFDQLNQLPIHRIRFTDGQFHLHLNEPKMRVDLTNFDVLAKRERANQLSIDLNSASFALTREVEGTTPPTLKVDLEANSVIARDRISVPILKITAGDSSFSGAATFVGDVEAMKFHDSEAHAKTSVNLAPLYAWASATFPATFEKVPPISGQIAIDTKAHRTDEQMPNADFSVKTEDIKIGKYLLARVITNGALVNHGKDSQLNLPKVEFDHPMGPVEADDVSFDLGEGKIFSANLKTKGNGLQLQELFKALGLMKIPVWVQVTGDIPCAGRLASPFSITCKGHIHGDNILVRNKMDAKNTITAVRTVDAVGETTIDKEKVTYHADLNAPDSKGASTGVISYEDGFKIDYEADRLSMKDVANLADLKIEGVAKVKGTTEGNADVGTLALDVDATDLWFEDYWLGNAKGSLGYKAGHLAFTNVTGYYSVSRYSAAVDVDLEHDSLTVNGRSPFFDARDMLKAFSHKVKLPFPVTGTGQAQVRASGPFAFNRLSYELKSSLYRGAISGESFDQAVFNVTSKNGEVKSDKISLQKGPATLTLTGVGHPDGTIKTLWQGRGFKLEDSQTVSSTSLAVSGNVDFDMEMEGPVLAPDTSMKGKITKTTVGEDPMPDSNFALKFTSKTLEGKGDFLGDVLKAQFVVPYSENAPFSVKVHATDWNYAPLFAALSGSTTRKDYEGRLSCEVNLASNTGGFWNSNGTIDVANFSLSHGRLALKSSAPLALTMKDGFLHVKKFALDGDNVFLKVSENPKPTSKVDLQVNGKLDLTLIALLTPFFEDMRGLLNFAFNVKASPGNLDLLGSAYLEKGYLKFFDFPHAFEDIRLDLLFNQKKIVFNSIKSDFAGGRVSGSGAMELKGYRNFPLDVNGQFEKIALNVPDKVKTTGSGSVSLSGNWFPFLLKGTYDVKDGSLTKEFGGDDQASGKGVRRDQFLPEVLLHEHFTPLVVDFDVSFPKGIQVKNELVDGRSSGQLKIKGDPTKPALLGQLALEKDTKLLVKDTTFDVTSSNIQFTDPNEVNPKLYVIARTHVQEYDVNLLIQGTGSDPKLSFTSVPPLAEKDIISLLAVGTTDQQTANPAIQANQVNQQQNLQQTQINSSSPLKDNPLSKEIKERTGFDVQFAPGFDESAATEKIIVRRNFNNKLSVAASQSMGSQRSSDAEVRYRLNDRISGIFSWQNADNLDTLDKTQQQEQNQFGLDLEYKFEFK